MPLRTFGGRMPWKQNRQKKGKKPNRFFCCEEKFNSFSRIIPSVRKIQCFGSGSAFILVGWIRIRIGNTDQDQELGWSVRCSLLRDKTSPVAYDQKNINFSAVNFFRFLVINTLGLDLDPDPNWQKLLDPDPHWNHCGSTTLVRSIGGFVCST